MLLLFGSALALVADEGREAINAEDPVEMSVVEAKGWIRQEITALQKERRQYMVEANPQTAEEAELVWLQFHADNFERYVNLRFMQESVAEVESDEAIQRMDQLQQIIENNTSTVSEDAKYQRAYERESRIQLKANASAK